MTDAVELSSVQGVSAMIVGEIKEGLAKVDGKVDKVLSLVEHLSSRHDRTETRVEGLKVEMDRRDETHRAEIRRLEEKALAEAKETANRFSAINWRLAMGVGGLSVLIVLLPIAFKSIKLSFGG